MIQRKIFVDVTPTPDELAFEFTNMGDEQQAMFFNELALITEKWDRPFCFQLYALVTKKIDLEEILNSLINAGLIAHVDTQNGKGRPRMAYVAVES